MIAAEFVSPGGLRLSILENSLSGGESCSKINLKTAPRGRTIILGAVSMIQTLSLHKITFLLSSLLCCFELPAARE